MSEDTGSVNKISGIWMQLDAILHRERKTNIWENRGDYSKVAPKKKEKLKLSTGANKYFLSNDEKYAYGEPSSLQQSSNKKMEKAGKYTTEEKFSEMDYWENQAGYINPLVECSFNLTRVSAAQLERLMGTNVVRLTDRKYMMELRQRIHEDFNDMLAKRIENREVKEMERQRNLFMEGKITQCSEEYNNHPIFIVNQAANQPIVKRRSKLKTNRQKNAERLIRQGAKWEKERQKINEIERQREVEEKVKQEAALNMVIDFHAGNKDRDAKLPRLRQSVAESDLTLKELEDDNEKSARRCGKSKANERRNNSTLKSQDSGETNAKHTFKNGPSSEGDLNQLHDEDDDDDENEEKLVLPNNSLSHRSQMNYKGDSDNLQYEDPMVSELKQTESVRDMYKLANEILCGKANNDSTISEESSSEDEEDVSDES